MSLIDRPRGTAKAVMYSSMTTPPSPRPSARRWAAPRPSTAQLPTQPPYECMTSTTCLPAPSTRRSSAARRCAASSARSCVGGSEPTDGWPALVSPRSGIGGKGENLWLQTRSLRPRAARARRRKRRALSMPRG